MQATYNGLKLPQDGQPIEYANGQFDVSDHPIIPYIEGDGTGRDIWRASERVFDAAVEKAYAGKRAIRWFEDLRRRKGLSPLRRLAAGRHGGRGARFARLHQGTG